MLLLAYFVTISLYCFMVDIMYFVHFWVVLYLRWEVLLLEEELLQKEFSSNKNGISNEFQASWAYKKYCLALGITVTILTKSSRGLEVLSPWTCRLLLNLRKHKLVRRKDWLNQLLVGMGSSKTSTLRFWRVCMRNISQLFFFLVNLFDAIGLGEFLLPVVSFSLRKHFTVFGCGSIWGSGVHALCCCSYVCPYMQVINWIIN